MVLCVFQGCLLGPDYQTPDSQVPPNWNSMTLEGDASGLSVSGATLPDVSWWRVFQNDELNHLIEQALERNHDVRQAGFRVLEARALAQGAGAGLYPNVSLDGTYTRVRRSETILVAPTGGSAPGFAPPGASFNLWNAALDLRWELDLWGRIRRSQEAFSAEAFASDMNRRGIVLSLISDVGQGYFRLRELDEQLEIGHTQSRPSTRLPFHYSKSGGCRAGVRFGCEAGRNPGFRNGRTSARASSITIGSAASIRMAVRDAAEYPESWYQAAPDRFGATHDSYRIAR